MDRRTRYLGLDVLARSRITLVPGDTTHAGEGDLHDAQEALTA